MSSHALPQTNAFLSLLLVLVWCSSILVRHSQYLSCYIHKQRTHRVSSFSLLVQLGVQALDLWRHLLILKSHEDFLDDLKCEFELLRVVEVKSVDESQKHGKCRCNGGQVVQHFYTLNHNPDILRVTKRIAVLPHDEDRHGDLLQLTLCYLFLGVLKQREKVKTK